jgi:predicted kinase
MRGIPGSGKSTKAKSLVGNGIIHSTDDLIEQTGDYDAFFKKMIETKDWSMIKRMHEKNLINAKHSMDKGISPVIIDNTNIRPFEPKGYVEYGLSHGYQIKKMLVNILS